METMLATTLGLTTAQSLSRGKEETAVDMTFMTQSYLTTMVKRLARSVGA
jgi:hypothetical protein